MSNPNNPAGAEVDPSEGAIDVGEEQSVPASGAEGEESAAPEVDPSEGEVDPSEGEVDPSELEVDPSEGPTS